MVSLWAGLVQLDTVVLVRASGEQSSSSSLQHGIGRAGSEAAVSSGRDRRRRTEAGARTEPGPTQNAGARGRLRRLVLRAVRQTDPQAGHQRGQRCSPSDPRLQPVHGVQGVLP